jgi:hypothetical protein
MRKREPFVPTDNVRVLKLLKKASQFNASLDAVDRATGFRSPLEYVGAIGPWICGVLRNAISAIVCGIEVYGWDEVAQGLVMVMQLEEALRNAGLDQGIADGQSRKSKPAK